MKEHDNEQTMTVDEVVSYLNAAEDGVVVTITIAIEKGDSKNAEKEAV